MASFIRIITIIFATIIVSANCGEFRKLDGRLYYISYPQENSWYKAYRYCATLGMYLVDIRTEEEHNRITNLIEITNKKYNVTGGDYWTCGTDLGSMGNFYWMTTGQSLVFDLWGSNEPSHGRWGDMIQQCLDVYYTGDKFKWYDGYCSTNYPFICRDQPDVTDYKIDGCSSQMNC